MSQPQPAQPNQPQYHLSVLNLFPVYPTRAAYQQATGQQAPPFDATRAIQPWFDPSPTGQPYNVFDPNTAANLAAANNNSPGTLSSLSLPAAQAATLNLPGAYTYTPYVPAPTDAMEYGPSGPIGGVDPSTVCMLADANALAAELAPLYPGKTLNVLQSGGGIYQIVYGLDPRRQYYISVGTGSAAITFLAEPLIVAKNHQGIGYPGHWVLQANGGPNWVVDPPIAVAPPNAVALLAPVRALLPNEQLVHLPGSLFNQTGTWVVERTDLPQPQPPETNDQQFADVKAALAAIENALGAIQTKLGA